MESGLQAAAINGPAAIFSSMRSAYSREQRFDIAQGWADARGRGESAEVYVARFGIATRTLREWLQTFGLHQDAADSREALRLQVQTTLESVRRIEGELLHIRTQLDRLRRADGKVAEVDPADHDAGPAEAESAALIRPLAGAEVADVDRRAADPSPPAAGRAEPQQPARLFSESAPPRTGGQVQVPSESSGGHHTQGVSAPDAMSRPLPMPPPDWYGWRLGL